MSMEQEFLRLLALEDEKEEEEPEEGEAPAPVPAPQPAPVQIQPIGMTEEQVRAIVDERVAVTIALFAANLTQFADQLAHAEAKPTRRKQAALTVVADRTATTDEGTRHVTEIECYERMARLFENFGYDTFTVDQVKKTPSLKLKNLNTITYTLKRLESMQCVVAEDEARTRWRILDHTDLESKDGAHSNFYQILKASFGSMNFSLDKAATKFKRITPTRLIDEIRRYEREGLVRKLDPQGERWILERV